MPLPGECCLLYGSDRPLPARVPLRAGPLSAVFENGGLRCIRLGSRDVLLMIYAAVRDRNWDTIPGVLADVRVAAGPEAFEITYRSEHRRGEIAFDWTGTITGQPDGTIRFLFDGQAVSTFARNRIGLCVLHALDCAGEPCQIEHVDDRIEPARFPRSIAPAPLFTGIRAITYRLQPDLKVRVVFDGEAFETEDQRNWTDASFKTYGTPLDRPFPVTVQAGERVRQSVRLELLGKRQVTGGEAASAPVSIRFRRQSAAHLPEIGLCATPDEGQLSRVEIARLGALRLSHLRVDAHVDRADGWEALARGAAQAAALGLPLEAAVHLTPDAERELAALVEWVRRDRPQLARWLVFHRDEHATSATTMHLARQHLRQGGVPVGGGTDAFFAELNRARPPVDAMDFAAYSINPQMHAFDLASVVETLAAQAETVRSARAFCAGLPIRVGPITFRMRRNRNADGADSAPPPDALPESVDARQMSLFGAGWTMGSIKSLAEAGAASLTYFGLTGWAGVMERDAGSPLPALFPSIPGGVFPLHHALADVGAFAGGQVIGSVSSDRQRVESLLLQKGNRRRLLLASFSEEPQDVHVVDLRQPARGCALELDSVVHAMQDPESFRARAPVELPAAPQGLSLALAPFGSLRLDWEER